MLHFNACDEKALRGTPDLDAPERGLLISHPGFSTLNEDNRTSVAGNSITARPINFRAPMS
jgi:hypothetical protein